MSLFLKLLTLPALFVLSGWLLPSIHYENVWIGILTIILLIATGIFIERSLLKRKTFWLVLFMDFVTSAFIIWAIASLFSQSHISGGGVLFLSIFITVAEYFVHQFLIIKERPIASTL